MQVPASALGGVCGMCSSGPGGAGAVGEGGCSGTSFSLVAFLAQGCAGSGNGRVGRSCSSLFRSVRRLGWAVLKSG